MNGNFISREVSQNMVRQHGKSLVKQKINLEVVIESQICLTPEQNLGKISVQNKISIGLVQHQMK